MMDAPDLPALPKPASGETIYIGDDDFKDIDYYTAGQMRAYASAALRTHCAAADAMASALEALITHGGTLAVSRRDERAINAIAALATWRAAKGDSHG